MTLLIGGWSALDLLSALFQPASSMTLLIGGCVLSLQTARKVLSAQMKVAMMGAEMGMIFQKEDNGIVVHADCIHATSIVV